MKPLAFSVAAFGLLSLGGCVIAVGDGHDDDFDASYDYDFDERAGTVYGAEVLPDAVTFTVTSNGCTDETFMDVYVERIDDDRYAVTVDREQADNCRALVPEGVTLVWSFADLGIPAGADVRIGNQVRRYRSVPLSN
ncbi:MAG: hypothetical protein AAFU66_10440 [Pseudomonadota bacterium]